MRTKRDELPSKERQARVRFILASYSDANSPVSIRAMRMIDQGQDVEIKYLRVLRSRADQSWLSRIWRMFPLYFKAALSSLSLSTYEKIFVTTSPPMMFVPFVLRGRITREDVILLHLDIFPENALLAGLKGPNIMFKLLGKASAKLARLAREHETLSQPMLVTLRNKLGTDIDAKIVPLPTPKSLRIVPKETNRWLKEKGLSNKFVVMYAGNFGRMYDFDPLLKAAAALREYKDIMFVFTGTGFQKNKIQQYKKNSNMNNVLIFFPEPKEKVSEILCAADLHVIPLIRGAEMVMWPHKLDALVQLGLETIAIGFDPDIDGVESISGPELAKKIICIFKNIEGRARNTPDFDMVNNVRRTSGRGANVCRKGASRSDLSLMD